MAKDVFERTKKRTRRISAIDEITEGTLDVQKNQNAGRIFL